MKRHSLNSIREMLYEMYHSDKKTFHEFDNIDNEIAQRYRGKMEAYETCLKLLGAKT
jgi:hypothetical protein